MECLVETLSRADVPQNVGLAAEVGWKDVASDWRVLHDAAVVVGVRDGGRVVAQGALGVFGVSGTIAKMIVARDRQRQGLGDRILSHLLKEAADRDIRTIGLVATDQGRPLYERHGFRKVGEVVVLTGVPQVSLRVPGVEDRARADDAVALDARWLGCSRDAMIRARHREASVCVGAADSQRELAAYGMATAQGQHALVGPIIASTEAVARAVTSAVFRCSTGEVRIDVPARQRSFLRWLVSVGLQERAVRAEMARGEAASLPWDVRQRFALAAQAWG